MCFKGELNKKKTKTRKFNATTNFKQTTKTQIDKQIDGTDEE